MTSIFWQKAKPAEDPFSDAACISLEMSSQHLLKAIRDRVDTSTHPSQAHGSLNLY